MTPAQSAAKRLIDIFGAASLIILTLPVTVPTAILVAVRLGRPVLFRQERHGFSGETFTIYKFRTMTMKTDGRGELLPDEQRITRLGSWLRATSIDELPELLNVLAGDMSLVGPRPLLTRYTRYLTGREMQRFLARPGITGLAQVNGRNSSSWEERLAHDVQYVTSWSLRLDFRILLRTASATIRREGVHVVPAVHLRDLDVERGDTPNENSGGNRA